MSSARVIHLNRAALEIAVLGFAVFPLRPRGKTPLTAHGHLDATTNLAVIRPWWEKWLSINTSGWVGGRLWDAAGGVSGRGQWLGGKPQGVVRD
jgi:hypothetical protein